MDREILVYVDLDNKTVLVGRLRTRARGRQESASFEYDEGWIKNPYRFSLEPALTVGPGPYHTTADRALFGAIGDSSLIAGDVRSWGGRNEKLQKTKVELREHCAKPTSC